MELKDICIVYRDSPIGSHKVSRLVRESEELTYAEAVQFAGNEARKRGGTFVILKPVAEVQTALPPVEVIEY